MEFKIFQQSPANLQTWYKQTQFNDEHGGFREKSQWRGSKQKINEKIFATVVENYKLW